MKLARIQVNGEVPVIGVLEGEQLRLTRESDALAVIALAQIFLVLGVAEEGNQLI